ncbi:MAG: capsule assembly Wzi family protein [Treponema sp.]|nr:capsule assembly Wzi family protein [Treponema sp.]
MRRSVSLFTIFVFALTVATGQEALKSTEEEYYDFLSLQGLVERPYLNYRTLSDSEWTLTSEAKNSDENVWKNNNLGNKYTLYENTDSVKNWFTEGIDESVKLKIYGPDWYNSYNTACPYGQNDGALWQGKGYNTSLTAGARLEAYGFELTFKPQICFSQNLDFDLMDNSEYYSNKYAYIWGYGNDVGVDCPQRFGDEPFWTFDWGDSEARYTWHNFTVGFGTQAIWLGPAWLNPLLHSNNAATYPKFDFGLRKTKIYMPFTGWDLGYIEGRLWVGYLSESDYFDDDDSNDHNMFHGLSISYAPSFLKGLTLGAHRTCLVKWSLKGLKYIIPSEDNYIGDDSSQGEDQRASFTADWIFPTVGFEVYGELGFDDGLHFDSIPNHARAYTIGAKKALTLSKKYNLKSEIIFEWNCTEMSQDFQLQWPYNFGFHHQITQGYTNRGQWLGAGSGYGGRGFFIGYKVYHKKGSVLIFFHHWQPDNNYIYQKAIYASAADGTLNSTWENAWKTYNTKGISINYYITKSLFSEISCYNTAILNPLYKTDGTSWQRNIHLELKVKYNF